MLRMRAFIVVLLLSVLRAPGVSADLPEWTLEIERLEKGDTSLVNIVARSQERPNGEAVVEVRAQSVLTGPDTPPMGPFSISCPGNVLTLAESLCRNGAWMLATPDGWPALEGRLTELAIEDTQTRLRLDGALGEASWTARVRVAGESFEGDIEFPEQAMTSLRILDERVPPLRWLSGGTFRGSARYVATGSIQPEARADFEIMGVGFDSPDGLYAGLDVGANLAVRSILGNDVVFELEGRLATGELLLGDFYRDFSDAGIDLSASVGLGNTDLTIRQLILDDGDSLHVSGDARIPVSGDSGAPEVSLRELRLAFPAAYTRYLEPVAAVFTLDGLETEGSVSWSGDWSASAPGESARSGTLRFEDVGVRDIKRNRFSISGLDGTLRTGSDSNLTWSVAAFERFDIGAGQARIALGTDSVSLTEALRIPVFGGSVSVEKLAVGFPETGEPDIQLRAALDDIDMQRMSQALGWPEFGGTLSGRIPGVTLSGGVIDIDGALDFDVFGGRIELTDLKVERPFGVLPSLAANITASSLDLEQLTHTFDFGRIAGRIDGYVHNLRMLDWQPVQFDAWFGTPENAGRQGISRQAVTHLATIGGGSSTALLSGPILRLFNDFSYKRLGIGCTLQDNVCSIRGIEQQGDAVLLLEGAGIPKISILAYNRAVDWPQLVAELTAVSSGDEVKIGQ